MAGMLFVLIVISIPTVGILWVLEHFEYKRKALDIRALEAKAKLNEKE